MIDYNELMVDYAMCYADKSRITFIEKYLYTFNAMKGKKTPFKLFPRQRVFLKTLAECKNIVSIKPRQCGITTLTSAWATGQCVFAEKDAPETILCIGNKLDLAQQLITKIQDFLLQVPRWYWGDEYYSPDPNSEKNSKSIFVRQSKSELELFNGCRIIARSSGENSARGISAVSILILDEAAFIENGVSVYSTASATMASNPNAKTVMVSTPNGKDPLYYNTYRLAMAKENNFVAVQFRWYQDPRYNRNLKWYKKDTTTGEMLWDYDKVINEDGDIEYNEERWERLVREGWTPTDEWYVGMCQSFNNDRVKIAQELDVSFVGSSDNVVDPEYIEMQEKLNVREPLEEMKDPLVEETWFWKPPIDGHRYICSCLPEGEQVVTQRGLVNVEDVSQDDLLVTKEGGYTKIKNRKYREVENDEVVEILPYGCVSPMRFTWNHPVYCSTSFKDEFDYIKSTDLKEGMFLKIPNIYASNVLGDDEILLHWEKYNINFHNQYTNLFENPLLNEDFWWYCGMWLAEGCIRHTNSGDMLITYHHIKETAYHERIMRIAKDLFSRSASLRKKEERGNGCDISFKCKELACFMLDTFGKLSYGKHIAEWVKFLPVKYKIKLVEGYLDGDGSKVGNTITAVSTSKKLLEDIQDILFSCGIVSSIAISRKAGKIQLKDRVINNRDSYYIRLTSIEAYKFIVLTGDIPWFETIKKKSRRNIFMSEDGNFIYLKVRALSRILYTGKVYNFETVSESHSFCCSRIATHNCDPSRGSSEDYSAIEIIDMDGRDENDLPIIEQVAQFYGKKLGNDLGEILYNYATLYNNAYTVIDATNGLGDVPLFTLLAKEYKNIYYDDASLKKYTVQQTKHQASLDHTDIMPGFHMQGNRYPVLANFANMVRNNEFKIRSTRTINELNTWIFKGESKRMDHQDGSHDDSITCLAMGLFVMLYSYKKLEKAANKDKAILNAYMTGNSLPTVKKSHLEDGKTITPDNRLPFYNENTLGKYSNRNIGGVYMWLFSGYK